jgi:hypothetical protein
VNTANTNIISANSITTTTANTANSVSIELNEIDNNGIEMYNPSINNWQRPFLRTVLSAENGTGSTARVGTLSVIWVILSILIYLVIINHKIPDNILSLGYFSTLIIVTLYSPLKIADILTSYLSKKR